MLPSLLCSLLKKVHRSLISCENKSRGSYGCVCVLTCGEIRLFTKSSVCKTANLTTSTFYRFSLFFLVWMSLTEKMPTIFTAALAMKPYTPLQRRLMAMRSRKKLMSDRIKNENKPSQLDFGGFNRHAQQWHYLTTVIPYDTWTRTWKTHCALEHSFHSTQLSCPYQPDVLLKRLSYAASILSTITNWKLTTFITSRLTADWHLITLFVNTLVHLQTKIHNFTNGI